MVKIKKIPEKKPTIKSTMNGMERYVPVVSSSYEKNKAKVDKLMSGINALIEGIENNYKELNKYYAQLYDLVIPSGYALGELAILKMKIGSHVVIKEARLEMVDGLLYGVEPVSLRKYPVITEKGDYSDSFFIKTVK